MRKTISRMVSLCLLVCSAFLFVGCPPDSNDEAIHKHAHEGDLKRVKEIIKKDPSQINIQDIRGFTPLQLASGKGHVEVVEYLLEHGADTELGNDVGDRPLSFAAKFGHYETVRILLERGARVNSKDLFGDTALHNAALWSGKEVTELLISYGAEVSGRNDSNDTPLHVAAMQNNIETAKALVEHGADIFAKNSHDLSKLDQRHKMDDKKWAETWANFLTRDTKNRTPREIALKAGYTELAQYLQAKEEEQRKGETSRNEG